MVLRPRRPLYGDGIAGNHLDMSLGRCSGTVTDDIRMTVLVGRNKAVVSLLDGPAKHNWGLSLERKARAQVAPIGDAVDDDLSDMAVR